jgi:membrane-associated protease RseP (regulator of RpoE activity)
VKTRRIAPIVVAVLVVLVAWGIWSPTGLAAVGVILCLPLIIMLHELAHYVTARRTGMKVTEFFVGFGPRIWSFKRGETEYGVKAVILGGYCRIIGMTNLEEVAPEDEPRAYRSKGYLARVGVAGAGPAVHFLIAFVLMFAVFAIAGDVMHQRALTRLDETSLGAQTAGIRAGDTLVSIDGTPITRWEQVSGVIGKHDAGDVVRFVVARDGQTITRDVTLTQQIYDGQKVVVAGIKTTILTPRPGLVRSVTMAPGAVVTVGHDAVTALGQIFSPSGISRYFHVLAGTDKSEEANQQRFLSPVGYAQVAKHAVDAGWLAVVQLLLVINVFLGLVNLVPLLPFDGGHIAIASYEQVMSTITRRRIRVDVAKLMPIAGAVLVVLLFIAVSSLFLDITHPVGNPY